MEVKAIRTRRSAQRRCDPGAKGFTPLPIRWRTEATFGTQTNHDRRLTRNWERDATAAEDAVHLASPHRSLRASEREITLPSSSNRLSDAKHPQLWNSRGDDLHEVLIPCDYDEVSFDRLCSDPKVVFINLQHF